MIPNSEIERAVECAVNSIRRRTNIGAISEDDLFQEGMLFAIGQMDTYDEGIASVMTFLFRPVKTHLNRILHREASTSGLLLPESEEELTRAVESLPQFPDLATVFSYESDLATQVDVRETLSHLTPEERDIVTDRFMNGVRLKDLAARFCISESAMHHRITKVIDKLRCRLGANYATS